MIDICDFAVGQSRLLNGFTMHSERKEHRMYDQYHPLGIVGLITSFNFPVAVWAWNSMIAAIAGDVVIWKPSSKTPLTAIAVQNIIAETWKRTRCPKVFSI
jgi:aldehyde dehydrogenase (NAD+)